MVKLSLPHPIPITNPTSPFRNFNFIRPIKIVGSDTDLHDYQVRIHLDRSNFPLEKCKPDGSDIRFRDDSGEILPYWIERWNAAEGVIWCKIPFIPAESSKFIWMIYGNPNAKSESNGNAVFEMFDVQGIIGFWHFDEPQWTGATGEVKDETGVNHATAYGGATTTSDAVYGRAGYFDGEDNYVKVPHNSCFDFWYDPFSIEGWIRTSYTGNWQGVVYHYHGKGYSIITRKNEGGLRAWVETDFLDSNMDICDGEWHHFVVTRGPSPDYLLKIYIDGELDATLTNCDGRATPNYAIDVGFGIYLEPYMGSYPYHGLMDEIRFYERCLSETEVKILSKNYMQKMGSYFNVRKYVTPAPVVIV